MSLDKIATTAAQTQCTIHTFGPNYFSFLLLIIFRSLVVQTRTDL